MRGALARVAVAVTAMVALAFLIPLALTVREIARDRAFADAAQQAAAIPPVLAVTTDANTLRRALASMAGGAGRIAIHLPDATVIGSSHATAAALDTATRQVRSTTTPTTGGYVLLQPMVLTSGQVALIEVYVPAAELSQGVSTAWLVLSGVAVVLVIGSTLVADRMAARLVRTARHLAGTARSLGAGDTSVRVTAQGPYELRETALAFNIMAGRMEQMLAAERELAADLSHRLRTPLTALRLNATALGDGPMAEQTRDSVQALERVVDQIIRAARQHGRSTRETSCDASTVARERLAFWSALAEDQERAWRFLGDDRPIIVPVTAADLAGALDALLGNVFRHTQGATGFAVTLRADRGRASVVVDDAGAGIDDPREALRRGHGAGGSGSTGLGLDIVRRIAEGVGGGVHIGRSPLGGARIHLWLPTEATGKPATATAGSGRHRRPAKPESADRTTPTPAGSTAHPAR